MSLIKNKPFQREHLDKTQDVFTVKLNKDERQDLDKCKAVLNQSKDSTALKDLSKIGSKVLLDTQTGFIIDLIFNNKRKNKRTGVSAIFDEN